MSAILAVTIFGLGYALIASEKVGRVTVVLGASGLLLGLRVLDAHDAFHSEEFGIDWNVVFLLLGMMVIVGTIQQTGLFDYLALLAVRLTGGRPFQLMVTLVLLTAVASALVDNVTTVLLVAPMTLAITRDLGLRAAPYLLAEAFASNIGGTATLIGDPPNIIIGSRAGLSYLDFLVNLGPIVVVLLGVYLVLCRVMFRSAFSHDPAKVAAVIAQDPRTRITDRRLLLWSHGRSGSRHGGLRDARRRALRPLGHRPARRWRAAPGDQGQGTVLREVEWDTLAFFAGLFIMVGALVKVGAVGRFATLIGDLVDGRLLFGSLLLLGASAVLSGLVDNIPYVATMAPVVGTMADDLPAGTSADPLWWSLALGADLGGNATPIGASANIVILAIAAKAGHPITFLEFVQVRRHRHRDHGGHLRCLRLAEVLRMVVIRGSRHPRSWPSSCHSG